VLDLVKQSLESVEVLIAGIRRVNDDVSLCRGVTRSRIGIRRDINPPPRVRPGRSINADRRLNVALLVALEARNDGSNPFAVGLVVLWPPSKSEQQRLVQLTAEDAEVRRERRVLVHLCDPL
jgi:hypothetical protein